MRANTRALHPEVWFAAMLLAAAPAASGADTTYYLSDLAWTSMTNGWGPAEKNMSNGEQGANDGRPITLNGVQYAKGLGVHAGSDIRYNLKGACSAFSANVGVDAEAGSNGSVVFQVLADGVKLYQSATLSGTSAAGTVNVNVAGRTQLQLLVTDAGNGNAFDHADWANARITCSSTFLDNTPPVVTSVSPASGSAVQALGTVTATFSEAISAATVTNSNFTLVAQGSSTPLGAAVSYDATRMTAVLTPSAGLQSGTTYSATVKGGAGGVVDINGNPMAASYTWSFKVGTAATAPTGARNLSEMQWVSATNGWGPVERNMSNGEAAAGDGKPLTINGVTYPSGLGTHAGSEIRYALNGACSAFLASVGVDDETGSQGSVVFEVWTDGVRRYQSSIATGATAPIPVNVSIAGALELKLVVTDAGDGNAFDHADWGNAQVSCGADTTPPAVTAITPSAGSTSVAATTKVTAKFSEAVNANTVSPTTFSLVKQGTTTIIPASIVYDANTFTATLAPASALQVGASYTATVRSGSAGVADLAGNVLMTDKVWSFTVSGLAASQPLVISGQSNVVISNVKITNPNGPCIDIRGSSSNITLQNSELGPCSGSGISVSSSSNVTVNAVYIHDTTDNGVTASSVTGLTLTNNRMERIKSGLYALSSTRVAVVSNNFLNVQGPMPRGQIVQFDKVFGSGNLIKCNVAENIMGQSYPEDAINMYQSNGLATDPIQIIGNKIRGGGPSTSGGGILLGDSGGSYQVSRDNILVDPGQYGTAAAGGSNISILNNLVYGRQQSFTNVGIYVWNQYTSACSNITVQGNTVNFTNSAGHPNSSWNAGNCGTVTGWTSNTWNAPISATIWDQPIAACQ